LLPNVGAKTKKFAIYSVESRFQKIPLTWVLGIEKFQQLREWNRSLVFPSSNVYLYCYLQDELLIDESFGNVWLEIRRF
jgi:hypothetical protein